MQSFPYIYNVHCIAVLQLVNVGDSFSDLTDLVRWNDHAFDSLRVLRVVGELDSQDWPHIHPHPSHRENCGTVASMTIDHMGLDRNDVLRFAIRARARNDVAAVQHTEWS